MQVFNSQIISLHYSWVLMLLSISNQKFLLLRGFKDKYHSVPSIILITRCQVFLGEMCIAAVSSYFGYSRVCRLRQYWWGNSWIESLCKWCGVQIVNVLPFFVAKWCEGVLTLMCFIKAPRKLSHRSHHNARCGWPQRLICLNSSQMLPCLCVWRSEAICYNMMRGKRVPFLRV